jgi:hypothetical protein
VKRKWLGPLVGILGLALCIAGGIGLLLRPAAIAYSSAELETPVVVIPPDVIGLDSLLSISITAPGGFDVRTARPVDAYAWAVGDRTSVVRGLVSWDAVKVDVIATSGSDPADVPGDLWRDWRLAMGETSIDPNDIEPGLAIVLVSSSDTPLSGVTLELSRDRGNGWAWPVVAGGLAAIVAGLVLIAFRLIARQPPLEATADNKLRKGTSTKAVATSEAKPKKASERKGKTR